MKRARPAEENSGTNRSGRAFYTSRDLPASAGRNNNASKSAPTCIRHRGSSRHDCGSDPGAFAICPDWTGRRPHRRRAWPRRAMRGIAARLRKQGPLGRAGRRKLPQIPRDLPKTGSQGCVRRIAGSLSQQGQTGRTRRRKLSPLPRNLQRSPIAPTRSPPHAKTPAQQMRRGCFLFHRFQAVPAHRGVYHRARIRATRWLMRATMPSGR